MAVYDYYKLLGVGRDATAEQIESAFGRLAEKCHPARHPDNEAAAKRFALLERAYQVLADPEKRARYDRQIAAHAAAASAPPATPPGARRPARSRTAAAARARRTARPPQGAAAGPTPGSAPARRPHRDLQRRRRTNAVLRVVRHALWWGLSAVVHTLVLLVLAGWYVRAPRIEELFPPIIISFVPPPPKQKPLDISSQVSPEPPTLEPQLEEVELDEIIDEPAIAELERQGKARLLAVEGPFAARSASGRARAMEGGGATKGSENAVNLGLLWLSTHQLSTGAWRTDNEMARWADPGITGLATLAFLGAGHTHRKGRYRYNVARAIAYIKQEQDTEGCIGRKGPKKRTGHMYCHGICTLALVEAYAMTKDPLLREPAARAVDFISTSQNSTGGWRYYYNSSDADSSVSGWMVMALRSARLAGIYVPDRTFAGARKFFDSVTNRERGYTSYMPGLQPSSPALVAVGLLCNQYLGTPADDPYVTLASKAINKFPPKWLDISRRDRMGLDNLPARQPGANSFYFWYYANLALHQRRGDEWDTWHPQVRDTLIKAQVRGGKDEGSWPPLSRWALRGGRVYSTAIAILTLEVYYRYAPMYREVVDEVLAAYGAAIDAYNRFARMPNRTSDQAAKAYRDAAARLQAFLDLTEPTPEAKPAKSTVQRRRTTVTRMIRLHRVAGKYEAAVAALEALPSKFPGLLPEVERKRLLAQCHLAHSRQLAKAGDRAKARDAEESALELLEELLDQTPGGDPQLELWVAERLFQRKQWVTALGLYKKQGLRLRDKKGANPKTTAYVYRRIVQCATQLRRYHTASHWLKRLRAIVGPSLAILREEAGLERQRGNYTAARRIYESILPRVQRLGPEWWQTTYDALLMAYHEGRSHYVAKEIGKLEVLHPEMGDRRTRRLLLNLHRTAARTSRG